MPHNSPSAWAGRLSQDYRRTVNVLDAVFAAPPCGVTRPLILSLARDRPRRRRLPAADGLTMSVRFEFAGSVAVLRPMRVPLSVSVATAVHGTPVQPKVIRAP